MADSLNDKWKQAVKDYEAKLPPIEATSPLPLRPQLWNWVAALFGIVATTSIGFALLPEQEAKPQIEAIATTAKSRPKQPEKSPSETYVHQLQVLSAGYRQQRD